MAVPGLSEFEHKPLRIEVVSWNVGNKQPDEKELEKLVCPWRYSGEANASQPDVIVVGTQECKYKQDKNTLDAKSLHKKIENKKIQEHKTEGSSDAAAVAAAVAAAEIDSGHSHWVNMLTMVVGTDYHIVSKEHLLEMRLVVFAKSNVLNKVTGVSHKHKATGIAHVYGNKGGLVSAIRFGGTGFSGVVLVVVLLYVSMFSFDFLFTVGVLATFFFPHRYSSRFNHFFCVLSFSSPFETFAASSFRCSGCTETCKSGQPPTGHYRTIQSCHMVG